MAKAEDQTRPCTITLFGIKSTVSAEKVIKLRLFFFKSKHGTRAINSKTEAKSVQRKKELLVIAIISKLPEYLPL